MQISKIFKSITFQQVKPLDPAIQGLRGIAVLSVLAFHTKQVSSISGYLGVDIFFVISGFLITRIISNGMRNGNFQFKIFLYKRIVRIFPALLFTLAISGFLATIILYPLELTRYSKHSLAGLNFFSNIIYSREIGYFEDASSEKPLLHLWSLSVEWQFYMIYPILIFLFFKSKINIRILLTLLLILSLTIYLYAAKDHPDFVFYMPFTRFWQFIAGGLVFYTSKRVTSNVIGGILSLFALFFTLGFGDMVFELWISTLIVTISTACLIYFSQTRCINLIFSNKVLVYFGNISYSLYLLHLPFIVFFHLVLPDENIGFVFVCFIVIAAHFSTKRIETPFLNSKKLQSNSFFLLGICLFMSIVSAALYSIPNIYDKIPFASTQLKTGDTGQTYFFRALFSNSIACNNLILYENSPMYDGNKRCIQSKFGSPDIQIIGDSHAEALYPGLAQNYNRNIQLIVRDGLPWITNPNYSDVFNTNLPADTIIIAGRWDLNNNSDQNMVKTFDYFDRLNKKVLILGDNPSFSFDAEKCKYSRILSGYNVCVEPISTKLMNTHMEKLINSGKYQNLIYMDVSKMFCSFSSCSMSDTSKIFFRDNNHLNLEGSRIVSSSIMDILSE